MGEGDLRHISDCPHCVMKKSHPIRCRCGSFRAELARPELGIRAVCYCRDCQAYAHFLGSPEEMLDVLGGTDIVAVQPRRIQFTHGCEHLACVSLSANGTLRWYAGCCKTPIGNTPRDAKRFHLGLVHCCLERSGASLDSSFGPVTMRVNAQSAKGKTPANSSILFTGSVLHYIASISWARCSGGWRSNPFFASSTGAPQTPVQVLNPSERAALLPQRLDLRRIRAGWRRRT